ncbi:putative colanic acid biosynthesis acetyltransferase [Frigidibacter albus]
MQGSLFALSPQPAYGWRCWLLRRFGAKVGEGVIIRPSARITYPWKVSIGDHSWIGDRAELYSLVEIEIGRHCCISQDCYLATGSHDHRDIAFGYVTGRITVADEAWLAAGTFVMPGRTVGEGAVVAARSMVTHDVAPATIVAGTPARQIGTRVPQAVPDATVPRSTAIRSGGDRNQTSAGIGKDQ